MVAPAASWGCRWSGSHVSFHMDNMAVTAVLQRQAPRDQSLTHMLHCLCLYAAFYGFEFLALYVPSRENTAADALSRDNITLFLSLFSTGSTFTHSSGGGGTSAGRPTGLELPGVDRVVQELFDSGIATTTASSY